MLARQATGETVSFFNDPNFVDTSREAANLRAELVGLGHTPNDFGGTSSSVWTTVMSAANVLVIPELERGDLEAALSASVEADIASFVSGGGALIVSANHSLRTQNLLNSIFGYAVVGNGSARSGSFGMDRPEAAGTHFASGPPGLSNFDRTYFVDTFSLPVEALALYRNGSATSVFAARFGAGWVFYLGFDWWAFSNAPGWGPVLDAALREVAGALGPPQDMYWIDHGTDRIERATLGGTNVMTVGFTDNPHDIAVIPDQDLLYWTEGTGASSAIKRSTLSGTDVTVVQNTSVSSPRGIALIPDQNLMYWIDHGTDSIKRATLSGTEVTTVQSTDVSNPFDIALIPDQDVMYWTEGTGASSAIKRATLSGTDVTVVQNTSVSSPRGIALIPDQNLMYWIDHGTDSIKRATLSGTNVTTVQDTDVANPFEIALLPVVNAMYWTEGAGASSAIKRATLSGTDATIIQDTSVSSPRGIATLFEAQVQVIPALPPAALFALSALLVLAGRLAIGRRRSGAGS